MKLGRKDFGIETKFFGHAFQGNSNILTIASFSSGILIFVSINFSESFSKETNDIYWQISSPYFEWGAHTNLWYVICEGEGTNKTSQLGIIRCEETQ